ncbi:transposase, partial [Lachnotalea glycerini]
LTDDVIDDLFYQQIIYLGVMKEIEFRNLFVDGTKIEANANRYTFVWKKVIKKNEDKMFPKIQNVITEMNQEEQKDFVVTRETLHDDLTKALEWLIEEKNTRKIQFVHGIGKRKTQIQRWFEKLSEYQQRKEKYDFGQSQMEGRNSYSKTDTDATFMHMKDDHMRNSQLKPAYNVQIGVESEYVVGVGIFQDRNDIATLIPMLNEMKNQLGRTYTNLIADSGYESEENYLYLEEHEQVPYIKPQTYEKWKKKSFKKDISKRENMIYDEGRDCYTCHNNKELKPIGITHRKSATGYLSEITIY